MDRSLSTAPGQRATALPVARCPQCALAVYPATVESCPRCCASPMVASWAVGDGVVWTNTVQRFEPKSPPYVAPSGGFVPFAVAYVETDEGFRVEGIVTATDPADVRIGERVVLTALVDDVPQYRLVGKEGQ